jgi:hypothetical protein
VTVIDDIMDLRDAGLSAEEVAKKLGVKRTQCLAVAALVGRPFWRCHGRPPNFLMPNPTSKRVFRYGGYVLTAKRVDDKLVPFEEAVELRDKLKAALEAPLFETPELRPFPKEGAK